jgi:hypothetical protein
MSFYPGVFYINNIVINIIYLLFFTKKFPYFFAYCHKHVFIHIKGGVLFYYFLQLGFLTVRVRIRVATKFIDLLKT